MRQNINISLPIKIAIEDEKAVKEVESANRGEFFRHLLRLWNTYKLAIIIKKGRKEFEAGKGRVLRSLKDLR